MPLPNGQLRWIAGRGHVECNGDGQPVRMRGAALDITKRKQAEEQLRMSEAALRKTEQARKIPANAVDLALWTWDIASDEILAFSESESCFWLFGIGKARYGTRSERYPS